MVQPSTPSSLLQSVTPPSWSFRANIAAGRPFLLLWDSRRLPADISLLASTPTVPEGIALAPSHHS